MPIFLPGEAVLIANGISKSVLLSYTKDTQYFQPLKEISTVTNGIILELIKLNENSSVTFAIFYQWIKDLYGDLWPQPDSPTTQVVSRSVLRLKAQFEKLKKLRSCEEKEEKVQAFLLEEFTLPTLGYRKGKVVSFSPLRPKRQRKNRASSESRCSKEMKQKVYAVSRNANKKLKRREALIQKQMACIETHQQTIIDYKRKLLGSDSQLKKLHAKLDRVNHRALYWKKRVNDISSSCLMRKKKYLVFH